jgi:hypothetical protein
LDQYGVSWVTPPETRYEEVMKQMLPVVLLLPALSHAGPFAGVWVIQPELTKFSLRSLSLVVDEHTYKRTSCRAPLEVPADGSDHPVITDALFNAMSVHVLDDSRVEVTHKVDGTLTWKGLYTVAPDKHSMTLQFTDTSAPQAVSGVLHYTREDGVTPGLHAISGTWRPDKIAKLSDSALTLTFRDTDNGLAMRAGDGRSYDAKFDRQDYPFQGDAAKTVVSVGHPSPSTLQINRKLNGQFVEVSRATVSDDGRTMTWIALDSQCQAATTFTLQKRPAS